ncbi:MAG: (E)-4-hydroxy-3-methylbut-2-enyl-diphosphate synthase [Marinifilaceae bacterium]|jgi:(E)-4-hydroxy-3-methylbut-2-enyl-diphosphate synthase|nr:(E)-4-hydroxy-3-methylbut-2-enyl-diphosphate synthase [Marinifilaceae bacterium]
MSSRRKTIEVQISNLKLGGENPVRIQSMTTTNTNDTEATVAQSLKILKAGGELVRVTTQGIKEAENTKNIKAGLLAAGYDSPLVADIHFNAKAADVAALYCDKVRINPGNYLEKRAVFKEIDYTDAEYQQEINKLEEKFTEFINLCKEHKTAIRIGTNQGSLSDRIMSRYGDTPEGMVEATMEFLRVCKKNLFPNVVISLKSSNTQVMVNAVRLLCETMSAEGIFYPVHLGVTEAGEGEDGRIKSAVGTGALLLEGIGDTVRVSLTEEPECEIPVAEKIVKYSIRKREEIEFPSTYEFSAKTNSQAKFIDGYKMPAVVLDFAHHDIPSFDIPDKSGYRKIGNPVSEEFQEWEEVFQPSDFIYIETLGPGLSALPPQLNVIVPAEMWDVAHVYNRNASPLYSSEEYTKLSSKETEAKYNFVEIKDNDFSLDEILKDEKAVAILDLNYPKYRQIAIALTKSGIPVIAKASYSEDEYEEISLKAAIDLGHLCLDKQISGLWIVNEGKIPEEEIKKLTFAILQGAHYRMSKTEFVSCPGCGRTLYDLQSTVAKVKAKLSHLKNLRIGIMGCIVNGPGEMGDVDYGYVGAAPGKITLYKGREVMKRNIPQEDALEELISLIKEHGDWQE